MSEGLLLASTDGAETADVAPELNPELDRAQIADAFRRAGRVHIPDILTNASARRLFRTLERETPWGLIFNEGKKTREFEAVSAEDHQEMAIAAWERAHTSFQYFYFYYRLLENRKIYPKPGHYLAKLVAFRLDFRHRNALQAARFPGRSR